MCTMSGLRYGKFKDLPDLVQENWNTDTKLQKQMEAFLKKIGSKLEEVGIFLDAA